MSEADDDWTRALDKFRGVIEPVTVAREDKGAGGWRYFASDGGLISYGPDEMDLFRRTAGYVDRILKGAKPSDLPVQQPTKFELVINLKTAKATGMSRCSRAPTR
jgi:ABC transporter substrate binding protein